MKRKKVIFNVTLAILAVLFFLYQSYWQGEKEQRITGKTMGTSYHIVFIATKELLNLHDNHVDFYKKAIDNRLNAINQTLSTYIEDSEISRFNQKKTLEPISVSSEFYKVFQESERIAKQSLGYYDPTVMPLVNLFGFGPAKHSADAFVSEKEISAVLRKIGYQKINSLPGGKLQKKEKDISLDLSSIAKGYGVDEVARLLDSLGIKRYLVEIGGEIRTAGLNISGKPWSIGIEDPVKLGGIYKIIALSNLSLATSGTYLNREKTNHKEYSHIIDPHTGKPITHNTISVSVINASDMTADGYATAFLSMGIPKGLEVAEKLGLSVLFITAEKDGSTKEYLTGKFKDFIVKAP